MKSCKKSRKFQSILLIVHLIIDSTSFTVYMDIIVLQLLGNMESKNLKSFSWYFWWHQYFLFGIHIVFPILSTANILTLTYLALFKWILYTGLFSPCFYFALLPLKMVSPCLEFAQTWRKISLYTIKFMLNVTLTRRNTAPRSVALTFTSRSRGKEIPKLSASVNNSLPSPDHCLVTRPT